MSEVSNILERLELAVNKFDKHESCVLLNAAACEIFDLQTQAEFYKRERSELWLTLMMVDNVLHGLSIENLGQTRWPCFVTTAKKVMERLQNQIKYNGIVTPTGAEAADRIEKLEAALWEIAWTRIKGPFPNKLAERYEKIAVAALDGVKKDD